MQKLTFTLNRSWIVAILFCTLSAYAMENPCNEREQWKQLALQEEEYNNTHCLLTRLLPELLTEIFSHCHVEKKKDKFVESYEQIEKLSLKKSIKNFMQLRTVCKKFNTILTCETIGNLCKNYDQGVNRSTLLELILSIKNTKYHANYHTKRLPTLILICANPDFSHILWTLLKSKCPSELMERCLKYNAHAKTLRHWDNSCLFHALPNEVHVSEINDIDELLRKGLLLLGVMSDMLNIINTNGQTPLDTAQESLEQAQKDRIERKRLNIIIGQLLKGESINLAQEPPKESELWDDDMDEEIKAFEQLIALYKEHGGKTAQELKQQTTQKL